MTWLVRFLVIPVLTAFLYLSVLAATMLVVPCIAIWSAKQSLTDYVK